MTSREILALARTNQERVAELGIISDPWLSRTQQTEAIVALAERIEAIATRLDEVRPPRRRMPWDRC